MPSREGDWEHYPKKFGKYHLLAPLAQGGMGALYLAVTGDRGLERLMVIKTVLPHLADAEYVARFRDEAKVVVKLSHGNLIPVFDAGVVNGEMFLAMDFVEGRDLRAVWNRCAKKQVAFPIDVAVYIVKELCRGLAYAHSFPDLHLVHRDISPPNVLVSYAGEVKLTDFGLASSTLKLEKTAPGIIYGKVAYMSPEQARGEKLDGRSDMYATGIVLWELLTGRQLFPPGKDQPQDLLSRAKNPEVMRPSKRAPRVPADLDEICLRALAPAKDDRYVDCDGMRQALQGWLATNAPTTDGTRMSTFLNELFSEDIQRERNERADMISRVRTRALTMPPTDELRRMVEKSDKVDVSTINVEDGDEAPVRKPGSVGRRSTDRGDDGKDRRKADDRRGGKPDKPALRPTGEPSSGSISTAAVAALKQEEIAPELGIGSEVDGRYKIVELIGEGGMGKVYLAEHKEIGKRVALKVLHPSYSRMPDLVERFRREARAASKIGHPNIVDVTDSGSTPDGSVYFVMEYLEGVELGSAIEREGALEVARALRITAQVCRALSAAHREGIIHRDLKPENIFLITKGGEADVVKVLDFGIAKTTEAEAARERRLTSPGMAMGTPEYMAPEQAAGKQADARTDIYSLGAIMYEMVTGVPPYSGDNFMEILTKKATQDPPPPITVRPQLALPISELVVAAMSRDPEHRPPTMDALEYELNKCLSGRGVAVAQILGMTTDANVVATLNPGLSVRTIDDGVVRVGARANTQGGTDAVWETRSGIARVQPGTNSGPIAMSVAAHLQSHVSSAAASSPHLRAASPNLYPRAQSPVLGGRATSHSDAVPEGSAPSAQAPAPVLPELKKRSGWSVLGWTLLVLVLLGGGGALAYFFLIQNQDKPPPPTAVDPNGSQNVTPGSGGSNAVKPEGDVKSGSNAPSNTTRPKTTNPPNPGGTTVKHPPTATANPPATPDKPPATLPQLLKEAGAAESSNDWEGARATWAKIEKVKGYQYPGYAVFKQAFAAFQTSDTAGALNLAQRAASMPGNQKTDAQFLYADALYKQGDYKRAKSFYLNLRSKLTGEKKAMATKKVAACNAALKLPERDGITGD